MDSIRIFKIKPHKLGLEPSSPSFNRLSIRDSGLTLVSYTIVGSITVGELPPSTSQTEGALHMLLAWLYRLYKYRHHYLTRMHPGPSHGVPTGRIELLGSNPDP